MYSRKEFSFTVHCQVAHSLALTSSDKSKLSLLADTAIGVTKKFKKFINVLFFWVFS